MAFGLARIELSKSTLGFARIELSRSTLGFARIELSNGDNFLVLVS